MPQMMPMLWFFIAIYVFCILVSITSFLYFLSFPLPPTITKKLLPSICLLSTKICSPFLWYWKW